MANEEDAAIAEGMKNENEEISGMSAALEKGLRQLLTEHRYESSMGIGQRGLMQHHVDALIKDLMPFLEARLAPQPAPGPQVPRCPKCGTEMNLSLGRISANSKSAVMATCKGATHDLSYHEFNLDSLADFAQFFPAPSPQMAIPVSWNSVGSFKGQEWVLKSEADKRMALWRKEFDSAAVHGGVDVEKLAKKIVEKIFEEIHDGMSLTGGYRTSIKCTEIVLRKALKGE